MYLGSIRCVYGLNRGNGVAGGVANVVSSKLFIHCEIRVDGWVPDPTGVWWFARDSTLFWGCKVILDGGVGVGGSIRFSLHGVDGPAMEMELELAWGMKTSSVLVSWTGNKILTQNETQKIQTLTINEQFMVACTEGPGHKHRLRKSGTQLSMTLVVCPLLSLWCGQGCYFSKSPCPYHICNLLNIQWHCKIPLYHTQDEIWHDYGELKIPISSRNQDLQLLWWQGNPLESMGVLHLWCRSQAFMEPIKLLLWYIFLPLYRNNITWLGCIRNMRVGTWYWAGGHWAQRRHKCIGKTSKACII